MKKRLITCVLACLMIFLVGCNNNGNTAKEAAQENMKTETSFPAGNTETQPKEETTDKPVTSVISEQTEQTEQTTVTSPSSDESKVASTSPVKPTQESKVNNAEPPKQTTPAVPDKQPEQPKETTAASKPEEKPTEKPAEPKPTEPPKQSFDVSSYVGYAKDYAVSIGLSLDSTATECWDNPISANPNRTGIKSDIESRLNRYKNSEGFTAVWIWAEKVSDTDFNIYIGYC